MVFEVHSRDSETAAQAPHGLACKPLPAGPQPVPEGRERRRRARRRGSETIEFTLALLPLLCMIFVLMDTAWAIFAKATLQRAVRIGVRQGITLTGAQMPQGTCATAVIKDAVKSNSIGLLRDTTKVRVNYFQPPLPSSNGAATDVSGASTGNKSGNIMQVSVQNFSLMPLVPRIFDWRTRPDMNPLSITVYSADLIEPTRDQPCIGTAP